MNALVLTTSYPLREGAIGGSFVRDLLRALQARGWDFDVVTPAGPRGPRLDERGIRVHEAPHWGAHWRGGLAHGRGVPETLASEPWKWLVAPPLVRGLDLAAAAAARARTPDVVWSHWLLPCGLLGAALARARGVPHVATAHGADVHWLERVVRVPGARAALAAAWSDTRLTAPSEHTARRVAAALGGARVDVCPLVANAPEAAGDEARRGLLFLGRFEPIKGPDLLLEACAALDGAPGVVTLAGAGSLDRALRGRADALAIETRFPGVLRDAAKFDALRSAEALVLPSRRLAGGRSEGFPHASMEALAAGTPVIAPAGGALGDWLERHGAGLAYAPGGDDRAHAASLAAALHRFLDDAGMRRRSRDGAASAGCAFRASTAAARWSDALEGATC